MGLHGSLLGNISEINSDSLDFLSVKVEILLIIYVSLESANLYNFVEILE